MSTRSLQHAEILELQKVFKSVYSVSFPTDVHNNTLDTEPYTCTDLFPPVNREKTCDPARLKMK